ncbi:MAG TPA: threonine/serine exporter family protein [Tetragenococcus sp.]|nr:threonine/serine exporter family protein [Tetragenococcus sp.]
MTFIIQFILSFFSTIAFGIISNIPRRALLTSGLTGTCGWLIYYYIKIGLKSIAFANFVAAFIIGCCSVFFSKKKKIPMIIFYIPSLVPLVPGAPAYEAVRAFVENQPDLGFQKIMIVVTAAISIAGGLMMTTILEQAINHWLRKQKN